MFPDTKLSSADDCMGSNVRDCSGFFRLNIDQTLFFSISSLEEARTTDWSNYDGLITIENSRCSDPLRISSIPQTVLIFDDISVPIPDYIEPQSHHIETALEFASQTTGRLLIHCHAGISRSTAICLSILAHRFGPGREREACKALMLISPLARPNALIIHLADEILGRDNVLFQTAWNSMQLSTPR